MDVCCIAGVSCLRLNTRILLMLLYRADGAAPSRNGHTSGLLLSVGKRQQGLTPELVLIL